MLLPGCCRERAGVWQAQGTFCIDFWFINFKSLSIIQVLPYMLVFGALSIHHARILKPIEFPQLWSNKLNSAQVNRNCICWVWFHVFWQNIFRLYCFVALLLNGLFYTIAPARINTLYQTSMVLSGLSLAFFSFNGAAMIGINFWNFGCVLCLNLELRTLNNRPWNHWQSVLQKLLSFRGRIMGFRPCPPPRGIFSTNVSLYWSSALGY